MKKIQKTYYWIAGLIVLIPEILFSFFTVSLWGFSNPPFTPLIYNFIDSGFFSDNLSYIFIAMIIECFGLLWLSILLFKTNKKLLSIILVIMFLWLVFWSYVLYSFSNINF